MRSDKQLGAWHQANRAVWDKAARGVGRRAVRHLLELLLEPCGGCELNILDLSSVPCHARQALYDDDVRLAYLERGLQCILPLALRVDREDSCAVNVPASRRSAIE